MGSVGSPPKPEATAHNHYNIVVCFHGMRNKIPRSHSLTQLQSLACGQPYLGRAHCYTSSVHGVVQLAQLKSETVALFAAAFHSVNNPWWKTLFVCFFRQQLRSMADKMQKDIMADDFLLAGEDAFEDNISNRYIAF